MHNVIVLGTGRSGTSMVTACFRDTGASFGDELIEATPANPYGYYECRRINTLNNKLIFKLLYPPGCFHLRKFVYPKTHEDWRSFWAVLPLSARPLELDEEDDDFVRSLVSRTPFCLKDPRFNATLPSWMPYLPDSVRFITVFRCPLRTVDSMLRDASETYSPALPFERNKLLKMWVRSYARLLKWAQNDPRFLLLDSESVINGTGRDALEDLVEGELNFDQVDGSVRRSKKQQAITDPTAKTALRMYDRLQQVAASYLERYQCSKKSVVHN
ncbi:hypothetical protein [Aeoliella mucimassa]|uniref:Sulfotransferase family protein n=1 Tax=Aeoliella mucimassa TaxID=2527972 RepID=A0A518AQA6_9BACT|nr:hypothetical protein [Aeoliella mucimassa]QDU56903.1 hypothetical protein Pan181_31150 [Aeoliella mucimassa]